MDKYQTYKIFCEKEKELPLFLTYKWMETVAPGNYDVIIEEKGNEIIGIFPYVLIKRKGFTLIDLPQLAAYGGVWIKYPPDQKYSSKLAYEKNVTAELIKKLPPFDFFNQKFHPQIKNWLPFYWRGFTQTTKYTYILDNLSDKNTIYKNFKENIRREIKKAGKSITVVPSNDIDILCKLKYKSFKQTGVEVRISENQIKKIFHASLQGQWGELLLAKEDEKIHCACFFVWDTQTCYYLYGVADPEHKTSGALSLVLWEAIQKYSSKVNRFDFDGSMVIGIERFFRAFGATLTPCLHIQKTNSKILKLRNFFKEFTR